VSNCDIITYFMLYFTAVRFVLQIELTERRLSRFHTMSWFGNLSKFSYFIV